MVQKRLLILGGNRFNVQCIRSARKAGFFTLVADRNPTAPGLGEADLALPVDLVDCEALEAAVTELGSVDGVVSLAEVGVRPAACLSSRMQLPSITQDAASNATSKVAMRRLWRSIGKYSVEFRVARTEADAFDAARQLGFFPLVFKPDRSYGGSRGVSRVDGLDGVKQAFVHARSGGHVDSDVIIEPCLEGTEHSAEVLVWQESTRVLCIGQKVKSPRPYRVDVSVRYPSQLTFEQESTVAEMCRKAVASLGITQGAVHVEFAYTASGPVLFELGARCGGGHTPQIALHVSGVDEFGEACRMACGMPPTQLMPTSRRGADYRFLVLPPGTIRETTVPADVISCENVMDVAVTSRPGDEVRPLRSTSDRAGFVVAVAADSPAALGVADWATSRITATYEDGTIERPYPLSHFG